MMFKIQWQTTHWIQLDIVLLWHIPYSAAQIKSAVFVILNILKLSKFPVK